MAAGQTACLQFKWNSSNPYEIRGRPGKIRDGNRGASAGDPVTEFSQILHHQPETVGACFK